TELTPQVYLKSSLDQQRRDDDNGRRIDSPRDTAVLLCLIVGKLRDVRHDLDGHPVPVIVASGEEGNFLAFLHGAISNGVKNIDETTFEEIKKALLTTVAGQLGRSVRVREGHRYLRAATGKRKYSNPPGVALQRRMWRSFTIKVLKEDRRPL